MRENVESIYSNAALRNNYKSVSFQKNLSKLSKDFSIDKKLSLSSQQSPSYCMAMKALQDRVKTLENENSSLFDQISQLQSSQPNRNRQKVKFENILTQITKNANQQKDQQELEMQKRIHVLEQSIKQYNSDFELQIDQIQQENNAKLQQQDQIIRKLTQDLDEMATQLSQSQEVNNQYKQKINQLNINYQKEKQVNNLHIHQQQFNIQLQLDNFVKSSKMLNQNIAKMTEETKQSKFEQEELQNYIQWYTSTYPMERYKELEQVSESLSKQCQLLQNDNEQQKIKIIQLNQENQILKLSNERLDSNNQQLQNQILLNVQPTQSVSVQYSKPQSPMKIVKNSMGADDGSSSFITRVKTSNHQQDTCEKRLSLDLDLHANSGEVNKQLIQLNMQLKQLDTNYDAIVRQAQLETDIKIKQSLRQSLIQILTEIKEINLQISSLQKQLKQRR